MGMENINGKMEENIKENINLIRNMEQDSILGLMAEDIMVIGRIAKDMVLAKLSTSMELRNMGLGSMTSE